MFDDTLILHGVCGLQTMCPQYISLAKLGCHFGSRIRTLILQDQRLSKPTLHFFFDLVMAAAAAPPMPVRPPHPVPEPLQARVDMLSTSVKALFTQKGIPYWVMAQMAGSGYTTMEDLADRWDTPALARQHAARDLQFVNDDHGWTAELRALISMKMFQCVRLAKETIGETPHGTQPRS